MDARAVDADRLAAIVSAIPGVKGVRAARSRRTSSGHLFAEVTILVDGATTVTDAHDFTDEVEQAIARELGTAEAIVHVEPSQRWPPIESSDAAHCACAINRCSMRYVLTCIATDTCAIRRMF